jgi:flagellar basal body-associated protein FliL
MANLTTNNANSKKGKFGTAMGITSIIAILVVLVLVVFAALSYTTSKADYSFAERTAKVTTGYYAADTRAEELTAAIAESAKQNDWQRSFLTNWKSADGESIPAIDVQSDGTHITFKETIDDKQELQVELLVANDGKISRAKWQVASTDEWEPDNSLNLIQ